MPAKYVMKIRNTETGALVESQFSSATMYNRARDIYINAANGDQVVVQTRRNSEAPVIFTKSEKMVAAFEFTPAELNK